MAGLSLTLAAVPPRCDFLSGLTIVDAQTLSTGNTYTSGKYYVGAFSQVKYTYTATLTGTTTPTFDFKVQVLMPDGSTWDDLVHDAQQSATATRNIVLADTVTSGGFAAATKMAASKYNDHAGGIGNWHRLVITVGGTNTSFATSVWMDAKK